MKSEVYALLQRVARNLRDKIYLTNTFTNILHIFSQSKIQIFLNIFTKITVNDEYVKLLVTQPEGGSGGPEGARRNEHGWPLIKL